MYNYLFHFLVICLNCLVVKKLVLFVLLTCARMNRGVKPEIYRDFGPSGVRALPLAAGINIGGHYFGPSEVRALPLAAGINVGGHYFGPSEVRALPLAAGINVSGHYF